MTATPDKDPSIKTYIVTLTFSSKSNPVRWISLVMKNALNEGETLYTTEVRESE